ncbi:hypothetical protein NW768_012119 [Fusarium equiseti]|uniref:Transcription factor n=1 Tax=Fusarium equiseti TaxID=61235 RepID=A0ABQ8QVM7_FUSEQ|nr:hypothetical protein NW768_012119 [Fusarium equiseti]
MMSQISARNMEPSQAYGQRCEPSCRPCYSCASKVSFCTSSSPDWYSADYTWVIQTPTLPRQEYDPVGCHPVPCGPLRRQARRTISTPNIKLESRATQCTSLVVENQRQSIISTKDRSRTSLAKNFTRPSTEHNNTSDFDDCPALDSSSEPEPLKSRWSQSSCQTFGSSHYHDDDSDTATEGSDEEEDDNTCYFDACQVASDIMLLSPTHVNITRTNQFDSAQQYARENFKSSSRLPQGIFPEVLDPARKILERISTNNAIFIPAGDPDTPPKGFFRRRRKLNPQVSSEAIATLKKRGTTVTAGLQVSFGIAIQEYQRERTGKADDLWASCANIDARRFFPEEFSAELKKVACYYTLLPLYVPISAKMFDKTAIELSDYYRKALNHPDAERALCVPAAMPLYMQMVAEGAAFLRTALLTSLGIVEAFMGRRFGSWEIEDFWLATTVMPPSVQIFIWTWRDGIVFGSSWNEAMFGADVIEGLLGRAEEILLKALQLT